MTKREGYLIKMQLHAGDPFNPDYDYLVLERTEEWVGTVWERYLKIQGSLLAADSCELPCSNGNNAWIISENERCKLFPEQKEEFGTDNAQDLYDIEIPWNITELGPIDYLGVSMLPDGDFGFHVRSGEDEWSTDDHMMNIDDVAVLVGIDTGGLDKGPETVELEDTLVVECNGLHILLTKRDDGVLIEASRDNPAPYQGTSAGSILATF